MTDVDTVQAQLSKLAGEWRSQAEAKRKLAKRHRCRSEEMVRHGYVRQAATLVECAEAIEAIRDADATATP